MIIANANENKVFRFDKTSHNHRFRKTYVIINLFNSLSVKIIATRILNGNVAPRFFLLFEIIKLEILKINHDLTTFDTVYV